VAGPFTVESLSPHRVLDAQTEPPNADGIAEARAVYQVTGGEKRDFAAIILDNLCIAGVQQAHKEDRIAFTVLTPWPGDCVCAEGRYPEGDEETGTERRAGIFVGPEFGTVSRPDLVDAAREVAEAGFDVLIACAFNYDAGASGFAKLGALPVLKVRMNADLHMAEDLKTTGKAEIDTDAWNTLYSDVSRPFEKPTSGRIAVKVINHLGDEVMKVVRV